MMNLYKVRVEKKDTTHWYLVWAKDEKEAEHAVWSRYRRHGLIQAKRTIKARTYRPMKPIVKMIF